MALRAIKLIVLIAFFATTGHTQNLNSEEYSVEAATGVGEVAIEQQDDYSLSYKQRRSAHGALLSVGKEAFYPSDYRSLYGDSYIENIIGEDKIDLVGIELGYKYNFGPMSISTLGTYSQGSIEGLVGGVKRIIKINKQGLSVNIALDAAFEEPWVVPYAQAGAHQFNINESNTVDTQSATTNIALNYRYGVLFQLDWIENKFDKGAKIDRLRSSGLENTYIDVYFAEHLASDQAIDPANPSNEGDPNLLSSGEIGVGLKMEF